MEAIDIKKYFEKVKKVFQSKKSFQKLLSKVNSGKLVIRKCHPIDFNLTSIISATNWSFHDRSKKYGRKKRIRQNSFRPFVTILFLSVAKSPIWSRQNRIQNCMLNYKTYIIVLYGLWPETYYTKTANKRSPLRSFSFFRFSLFQVSSKFISDSIIIISMHTSSI